MRSHLIVEPSLVLGGEPRSSGKRLVLGLDLGTSTGATYAWYSPGEPVVPGLIRPEHMGQWDLSAGPYDSGAIRFLRMRHFLEMIRPDLVVYEDVKFKPDASMAGSKSMHQIVARIATSSEFLGALKATLATWCEEHQIPCSGYGIAVMKKRATGKGNANKEAMIAACNSIFGSNLDVQGYENTGVDNIADSAFVCLLGLEQYASGLPPVTEG